MRKSNTFLKSNEKKLLETLAELGGNTINEDSLVFEGTRLVLPETMTPYEAIETIDRHIKQQEADTAFSRTFQYRPWDGAAATQATLKKLFGFGGIGVATMSFFGSNPPELVTINVSPTETVQVPWGQLELPALKATLTLGGQRHPEYGLLFSIDVTCPRKYRGHIEGLFKAIEEELSTNSIYKSKAIDGQDMPEFIDLSGVDPSKVIYTDEVRGQLEANVWSALRHTDVMDELGLPLKRSVLLHGPYGTGKTLAAYLTAQIATENGWTFIYCRPGKDKLGEVMQTARLYQPAVVFFEDVDGVASNGDDDSVTRLLDIFDGIQSKGTKLLAIMTSNHADRIHKGMVRPGRLDAVIRISSLDNKGIMEMVRSAVPSSKLGDVDEAAIGEAMHGFMPCFVKEAIDRTLRYAVARSAGNPDIQLTTADFVLAASGLRDQLDLMENAGEGVRPDTLGKALERIVRDTLNESDIELHGDPAGRLLVGEADSNPSL